MAALARRESTRRSWILIVRSSMPSRVKKTEKSEEEEGDLEQPYWLNPLLALNKEGGRGKGK